MAAVKADPRVFAEWCKAYEASSPRAMNDRQLADKAQDWVYYLLESNWVHVKVAATPFERER
jgi:hypothetical protein